MKLKRLLLFFLIINIISCQKTNYELIYEQNLLTTPDCKNIKLAKWILLKESGLKIDQKVQIIVTDYDGGIPLQIRTFPIYYKVQINENQYNDYKNRLLTGKESDDWRFYEEFDELHFVRANKFELSCTIKKDTILFGFRNVEGIFP
ncbi:MAG: hypothetical protein LBI28_07550 [Treponema sp.]|jgi:hypothetical protein|nr:hypothetical protein [Treponema sp.]